MAAPRTSLRARSHQPTLPDVPAVTAQGFDSLVVTIWLGLYAPKGTPKPIVDKLSAALQTAMVDASVKEKMSNLGIDVMPRARATPDALRTHLKTETDRWIPLLKKAGVVPQ